MRSFRRRIWYAIWMLRDAPLAAIFRATTWRREYERFEEIALDPLGRDRQQDERFLTATKQALALIRDNDPRRYAILQREVQMISHLPLAGAAGVYMRFLRICGVDFRRLQFDEGDEASEWWIARYAAVLVHEATHGRLASLWFPYTARTRLRIERICRAEERRFVARLKND